MKIKISKNKGMTLIEALIWMAISGVVIVSAFILYSNFRQEQKADQVISELGFLYKNIRPILNNSKTGESVTVNQLNDMGAIPSTIKMTSAAIPARNVFGGTILTGAGSNASGGTITITYSLIPTGKICNRIFRSVASQGWATIGATGYATVNINSSLKLNNIDICNPSKAKVVTIVFQATGIYMPTDLNAED